MKAADGRRQKDREIIHEEREKYRAKNKSLENTSTDSKETTFVILKNHACMPIKKERLSPTIKTRREASRNEFVAKGGMSIVQDASFGADCGESLILTLSLTQPLTLTLILILPLNLTLTLALILCKEDSLRSIMFLRGS